MLFLRNNLEIPELAFKQAKLKCISGCYALLRSKAHTSGLHPAVVMLSRA